MCCGVCGVRVVLLCCVVGCGMAVGGVRVCGLVACLPLLSVFFLLFLFLFVLVFGVVRAQPCEHARYPRTPLCLPCCFVFSSLCASPFFMSRLSIIGMAVCVYHVSECCVGMTAMGSLSRSFSFFW